MENDSFLEPAASGILFFDTHCLHLPATNVAGCSTLSFGFLVSFSFLSFMGPNVMTRLTAFSSSNYGKPKRP